MTAEREAAIREACDTVQQNMEACPWPACGCAVFPLAFAGGESFARERILAAARVHIRECAEALIEEINARYAGTQNQYPHLAVKYRLDTAPATNALAWAADQERKDA